MIIAVDGVRLGKRPTGVTDITISIINAFSTCYPEVALYVFVNKSLDPEAEVKILKHKNLHLIIKPMPFLKNNGLLWTLFKLNRLVSKSEPDLFIEPNFLFNPFFFPKQTKVATYIHDVVFKEQPETMELITRVYMALFLKATFKRTDIIWTNSYYTKERLLYHYQSLLQKKQFFKGSGVNPFLIKKAKEISSANYNETNFQFNYADKYLLFVGTVEPRKNIAFLLNLFASMSDKSCKLVIAGGKGWGLASQEINQLLETEKFPKERVIFTGYVSSDDLIRLYKNAFVFISTSYNEGLGLPQLEAMACGCPVISPHNSAMIEVVEGAGITVTGWHLDDWLNAIKAIEQNRQYYIDKANEKLKNYDWNTAIKDFYERFLLLYEK